MSEKEKDKTFTLYPTTTHIKTASGRTAFLNSTSDTKARYNQYLPFCNGIYQNGNKGQQHGSSNHGLPKTYQELKMLVVAIGDYWDVNIACVAFGNKIVAITNYMNNGESEDPETDADLYFDKQLHDLADSKESSLRVMKRSNHYLYYKETDIKNAIFIDILFSGSIEIYRSLALGYPPIAIVLYDTLHKLEKLSDKGYTNKKLDVVYPKILEENLTRLMPRINHAINNLEMLGIRVNKN